MVDCEEKQPSTASTEGLPIRIHEDEKNMTTKLKID
jgi:hypothetical protein